MAYAKGYLYGYIDPTRTRGAKTPTKQRGKKNRTPGYYMEWFNGRTRLVWME